MQVAEHYLRNGPLKESKGPISDDCYEESIRRKMGEGRRADSIFLKAYFSFLLEWE